MSLAKIDGAGELLETEGPRESRRAMGRDQRRFGDDGAAAAHRIEQRVPGRPPGQRQQAGREIFPQRRLVGVATVAALEQRLSRRVEVDRRLAIGQVHVDAHIGRALVDRRTNAVIRTHAVADGVLRAERRKFEAGERRADRCDVDA